MYVCICHAITEDKLREAMKESATVNSRDVLKRLGVGESCGICLIEAMSKIETMGHSKDEKNTQVISKTNPAK